MPSQTDLIDRVANLKAQGEAFCLATVVRTVSVTAAKAGAKAVIRADGSISDGWIGGGCARAAVLKAARAALYDGQTRLVSVLPKDLMAEMGLTPGDERDGVRFARNMCPSQGTMDIFIEPILPHPSLVIVGASPVAVAVAEIAPQFGFRVIIVAPAADQVLFSRANQRIEDYALPDQIDGQRYVVVSTQGRGDEAGLKAALASDALYCGFVGSRRKLAALREKLIVDGLSPDRFDRVKGPAGLDIGAITPEEIALSIMAEIVMARRSGQRTNQAPDTEPTITT